MERKTADGSYVNLYPELLAAMKQGRHRSQIFMVILAARIFALRNVQKAGLLRHRIVRTFSEYTPWFIKPGREDLIERYKYRWMSTRNAASSSWRTGIKSGGV